MAKKRADSARGTRQTANDELAQNALRKRREGKTPTHREAIALARVQRAQEETLRWQFYRSIPQKHWREMSGRQTKQINEQAARYGIPFGGKTIDLPEVVLKLFDFLAANAIKLAKVEGDDELLLGPGTPWLEELRKETAKIKKMDRLERERTLLPRDEIHEALGLMAAILRNLGETLQRLHGPAAQQLLNDALDDYQREIDTLFKQ